MPAPHDLDPPSMTEDERLGKRRYQAYHAFESEYPPVKRSRVLEFQYGTIERSRLRNRPSGRPAGKYQRRSLMSDLDEAMYYQDDPTDILNEMDERKKAK